MKYLLLVLAALSSAAYAKGSQSVDVAIGKPCFITVAPGQIVNANTVAYIERSTQGVSTSSSPFSDIKQVPIVAISTGRVYFTVRTPDPDALIAKFLKDVAETCK